MRYHMNFCYRYVVTIRDSFCFMIPLIFQQRTYLQIFRSKVHSVLFSFNIILDFSASADKSLPVKKMKYFALYFAICFVKIPNVAAIEGI